VKIEPMTQRDFDELASRRHEPPESDRGSHQLENKSAALKAPGTSSVVNLEEWLRSRSWTGGQLAPGPISRLARRLVIVAGLAILLLHTLYPYPTSRRPSLNPAG
jgi:hypothetical protein